MVNIALSTAVTARSPVPVGDPAGTAADLSEQDDQREDAQQDQGDRPPQRAAIRYDRVHVDVAQGDIRDTECDSSVLPLARRVKCVMQHLYRDHSPVTARFQNLDGEANRRRRRAFGIGDVVCRTATRESAVGIPPSDNSPNLPRRPGANTGVGVSSTTGVPRIPRTVRSRCADIYGCCG